MKDEARGRTRCGWDAGRGDYVCRDGNTVKVPRRCANIRNLNDIKRGPRNKIIYSVNAKKLRISIPGAEFDRCMVVLFGGSDGVRTMIFPSMVRVVRQGAFFGVDSLLSVVLNEGLEALGTDEYLLGGKMYPGVFQGSGLKQIRFPPTLKRIEYGVFADCENLKTVELPDGLKFIGSACFQACSLEEIQLPASVKTVSAGAFSQCRKLRCAQLNEGLEVLGAEVVADGSTYKGTVFFESALEGITLPRTLKTIEKQAFAFCKNLKRVEFEEGLEFLGREEDDSDSWTDLFSLSGIEEVVLPSTLKEMKKGIFSCASNLRVVRVARGCAVDVSKYVRYSVEVKYV